MSGPGQEQKGTADDAPTIDPGRSEAARCSDSGQGPGSSCGEAQQAAAPGPQQPRVRTIARWVASVTLVAVLASAMVAWLIFLAWAGRRLLALL